MIITISRPVLAMLLVLSCTFLSAQLPITFSENLGDVDKNIIQDVIDLDGQGCLTIGYTKNEATRNVDVWINRVDTDGSLLWTSQFGGTCFESANAAALLDDGNIVIVGQGSFDDNTNPDPSTRDDGAILKIDMDGNLLWQRTFGGLGQDQFIDVVALPNGQCVAVGSSTSYTNIADSRATDGWAVRINANGAALWNHTFGGELMDSYSTVLLDEAGDLLLGGTSNSRDGDITNSNGLDDLWVSKLLISGDLQWSQKYGGAANDILNGMTSTIDGGYVLAGTSYSSLAGHQGHGDVYVLKISEQGAPIWQHNYGGSSNDKSTDIIPFEEDGFLVASTTFSDDGDIEATFAEQDAWLAKLDANGEIVWQQTLGGSKNDAFNALASSDDGSVWMAGYSFSADQDLTTNFGAQDGWLIGSNDVISTPDINIMQTIEQVTCFGFSDGSISLTVTGDTPPFSFMWSNGFSSSSIFGLSPGDYTVTVTDATGFQLIKQYSITEPDALEVFEEQTNAAAGQDDGRILLNIIGGTPSYDVQWSNGGTGILQENLAPGVYTATITDANDCELIVSFEIEIGTATTQIVRQALELYPNPNNGTFTVELPEQLQGNFSVALISLDGKKMDLGIHNQTSTQLSIITQRAIAGLYILTLQDDQFIFQSKLIIQP